MKKKCLILLIIFVIINLILVSPVFAEDEDKYENFEASGILCGSSDEIRALPKAIPNAVSKIYTFIRIAVPVLLVIMGSIDFLKGVTAQKEEDMKKNQKVFIKRLISGMCVFLVFSVVKLVISVLADNTNNTLIECTECIISYPKGCGSTTGRI